MRESGDPFRGAEVRLGKALERARSGEQTGFTCEREGKRWRLELWGLLPPHWSGNLSLQCWSAGIDIAEGVAFRVPGARWGAAFWIAPVRGSLDLRPFDFLRMARRRPSATTRAGLPRLDSFEIERPLAGGALHVSIRGKDEPGFLAALLERFALFALLPDRFVIGSEGDRAVDWFALQAIGGADPSPQSAAALRGALAACLP